MENVSRRIEMSIGMCITGRVDRDGTDWLNLSGRGMFVYIRGSCTNQKER